MKVITNNYKPEFPKQVICKHCKSVLEYEKEDIQEKQQKNHDQGGGTYVTTIKFLNCFCCKNLIEL